jgi:UPF0755 protein
MKRVVLLGSLLVVSAIAVAAALVALAVQRLDRPMSLNAPVRLTVPAGATIGRVAADLARQGVLTEPRVFIWYARYRGLAAGIKAGTYQIDNGMTPRAVLETLVVGRVLMHTFTIVDGWRVQDLLAALRRSADIASTLPAAPRDLMRLLGSPGQPAEGQFLPDTYTVPAGATDLDILRLAHAALVQERDADWAARDPGIPLRNAEELATLASIVEKETALGTERAKIAGVYLRRLEIGMRLQADPTVIYGVGAKYDGNLRLVDLRTDGPYNTYTRAGLPPTPIALAGPPALRAVAHPEKTLALYFVASGLGDGSHVFSSNLRDHNAAVESLLARQRAAAAAAARKNNSMKAKS